MEPLTTTQLQALPPLVDLMTAARVLGLGRTTDSNGYAVIWPSSSRFKPRPAPWCGPRVQPA